LISFVFFLELSRLMFRWDKMRSGFDPAATPGIIFSIAESAIFRFRAA